MTSREIVDGLIRRERVLRLGLYDSPWGDTLSKWAEEEGYPRNGEGHPADPCDHFGFDMVGCGGWFDQVPLRGHSEVIEETQEWILKRNGAGAALKTWKHKSGTPEHVDFRMNNRQVWDREYRPHLLTLDPARLDVNGTRRTLERRKAEGRWTFYGSLDRDVARGLSLRLDHGSQFLANHYQQQLRFWGITPSFAFLSQPQTNGVAERFIRTLKEQAVYGGSFNIVEDLRAALSAFVDRYNREWLIAKLGHRSTLQACNDYATLPAA
jgi:hypothetical protein